MKLNDRSKSFNHILFDKQDAGFIPKYFKALLKSSQANKILVDEAVDSTFYILFSEYRIK